ncbi:MAG: hypothetical protein HYT86_02630, partial [candidate division NC10 bacterium]|nr:hypothetical protein [candidate division NC10 bacterium]
MNLQARIGSALRAKRWKGIPPLLKEMGFAEPQRVLVNLRHLHQQEAMRDALPMLLSLCASSPDPDLALHGFESVASAPGSVLGALRGDDRALGTLASAFALSPYFTTLLVRNPHALQWLFCEGGITIRREGGDSLTALRAFAEPIRDFADLCAKLR